MPLPDVRKHWRAVASCVLAFAFAVGVNGVLPFLAIPTMGQAIWTTGFSRSFIRGGVFNIYAHNFGQPDPAAIVFGLPGAYPAGLLIGIGLHPADAYACVLWLWIAIALAGAIRVGKLFGLTTPRAALTAALWLALPLVWNHAHYSMLSMGFALLPAYSAAPLTLLLQPPQRRGSQIALALQYALTAVTAAFMDGYTFVLFAIAATVLLGASALRNPALRPQLLRLGLPLHVASLATAFALYRGYVGRAEFSVEPLEAFRGWGVDLHFLVVPTLGTHWLFDAVGWSVPRSPIEQFGDASVWQTTFLLPLLLAGVYAFWAVRRWHALAVLCLLLALFGGYMALGPSLKVHATRPVSLQARHDPLMPPELAGMRTGNAVLSRHLPGFKNMRASYRWLGLCALGLWLLVVVWLAQPGARRRWGVVGLLLLAYAPHPLEKWTVALDYRANWRQLDREILAPLHEDLQAHERVAFLPFGNDFLINYLASDLDVAAYNIGGDKNLAQARRHWPPTLQAFTMGEVDAGFADRVARLLQTDADVVVLPYCDLLWSAHHWPCGEQHLAKCPAEIAHDLADKVAQLQGNTQLNVVVRAQYVVVRPRR